MFQSCHNRFAVTLSCRRNQPCRAHHENIYATRKSFLHLPPNRKFIQAFILSLKEICEAKHKISCSHVVLQPTVPNEVEVEVNLRPTVSRPVCLGVRRSSGTRDQFFFLLEIFFRELRVCDFVAPFLTRGRVCNLLYNCLWALPEQSLSGPSPAELRAIFYCLIWDSPNLEGQVPVFISPGTGWPSYTPGHWVPFMSPLTTRRAAVEVF
jgi:hypothetical protein